MAAWWRMLAGAMLVSVAAGPLYAPQALAFPYRWSRGGVTVWSDAPVPSAMSAVLARADALVGANPLATVPSGSHIFLTDGGWRWRWLSLTASRAFALTRPLSEAVIVNRSDVAADRVANGARIGGTRTLSGVLAHERTHTLMRARYGQIATASLPLWVREGYPDYVAHESSLSDAQATAMRRAGLSTPALTYQDARQRVTIALALNGGSVDRMVAENRH